MEKDRKETEKRILKALEELLKEKGFTALGINAIARKAGVSKVLIYRYFDDLNGLVRRWVKERDFWSLQAAQQSVGPLSERRGDKQAFIQVATELLVGWLRRLREDPLRRELLRWQLSDENQLLMDIGMDVESAGLEVQDWIDQLFPVENSAFFSSLIMAGISHLTLMSDRYEVYNGIRLREEEDWQKLEKTIHRIIVAYMDSQ